jgi:hypothetical protein
MNALHLKYQLIKAFIILFQAITKVKQIDINHLGVSTRQAIIASLAISSHQQALQQSVRSRKATPIYN